MELPVHSGPCKNVHVQSSIIYGTLSKIIHVGTVYSIILIYDALSSNRCTMILARKRLEILNPLKQINPRDSMFLRVVDGMKN